MQSTGTSLIPKLQILCVFILTYTYTFTLTHSNGKGINIEEHLSGKTSTKWCFKEENYSWIKIHKTLFKREAIFLLFGGQLGTAFTSRFWNGSAYVSVFIYTGIVPSTSTQFLLIPRLGSDSGLVTMLHAMGMNRHLVLTPSWAAFATHDGCWLHSAGFIPGNPWQGWTRQNQPGGELGKSPGLLASPQSSAGGSLSPCCCSL